MPSIKYAVEVPFDEKHWLFVSAVPEDTIEDNPVAERMMFDTIDQAKEQAAIWNTARVVEFHWDDTLSDWTTDFKICE